MGRDRKGGSVVKAEIQWRPATFELDIWLWDNAPDGNRVYNLDGTVRETVARYGEDVEPSGTVSRDVIEALVAAGSDFLPPSGAMQRHLDDAISVRDRLLALVENGAQS